MALRRLIGLAFLVLLCAGAARADYPGALDLIKRGNFSAAITALRGPADAGDARAQVSLGFMYEYGRGTPQDLAAALHWYKKAADQGDKKGAAAYRQVIAKIAKRQESPPPPIVTPSPPAASSPLASTRTPADALGLEGAKQLGNSIGTAYFVSRRGHLLTNHHVVKNCRDVRITGPSAPLAIEGQLSDDQRRPEVVAMDEQIDLALLHTRVAVLETVSFRAGRGARLGEDVLVVGYPLQGFLSSVNVTKGSVSAIGGLGNDRFRFQFTAPIQIGNSGGPVLDRGGKLMGMVVEKLNALKIAKITGDLPQNVNFAIHGAVARLFLDGQGVEYAVSPPGDDREPEDVATQALKYTVHLTCAAFW